MPATASCSIATSITHEWKRLSLACLIVWPNSTRIRFKCHGFELGSITSSFPQVPPFIKSALNVLSLYKWMRTIVLLVRNGRNGPYASITQSGDSSFVAKAWRRRDVQNLVISAVFFYVGVAILVHATVAITSTKSVCDTYRQCAVPRYQWKVGAKHCPCIVFVDRSASVRTFKEWENPPDTTPNLAALATTGHLRIIQIINYALPELPDELRDCHELEQLILIYTKTVRFPSWAKELRHLEYMHIEGDFTSRQLVSMPDDLFEDIHTLVFLHLGSLIQIPRVPDLRNLTRLRFLLLALLHAVTELPTLEGLASLRSVSIVDAAQVHELPPISKLHLQFFALAGRKPVCCNGFMTGSCDLSDHQCQAHDDERSVQCTTKRYSTPDLALATSIPGIVCEQNVTINLKDMAPTVELTDVACGGVMYKQCELNGIVGICFNARMTVVSCVVSAEYENMRRLQIARGVAKPCDPKVEAWLGCTK